MEQVDHLSDHLDSALLDLKHHQHLVLPEDLVGHKMGHHLVDPLALGVQDLKLHLEGEVVVVEEGGEEGEDLMVLSEVVQKWALEGEEGQGEVEVDLEDRQVLIRIKNLIFN